MARFLTVRLIGSVVTLLCMLVSVAGVTTATRAPSYVICDELSGVTLLDQIRIDLPQLKECAATGTPVTLAFSGMTISFRLISTDLDAFSEGSDVRTYAGISDQVNLLRATLTSEWVRMSFVLSGKDFSIEPSDGTGASGTYAVYSSDGITVSSDYSNDTVAAPLTAADTASGISISSAGNSTSSSGWPLSNSTISLSDFAEVQVAPLSSSKKNETCPGGGGDPQYRLARIVIACDVEYRNLYPSDWDSRMRAVLSNICGRYQSQVGMSFSLVAPPYAIPAGVCTSTDSMTLLSQFKTEMETDPLISGVARDVSHLFTGKHLDGSAGGASYQAGVGRLRWDSQDMPYSLSEQWHSALQNNWGMGHEIGHNFNGDHHYWAWIGGSRSWMYSSYTSSVVAQFSTNNANRVKSWTEQSLDIYRSFNYGPSTVSSENLQTDNFLIDGGQAVYLVGNQWYGHFNIWNKGSSTVTLELLFIVARDASGNNRDFGHVSNVVIGPGAYYAFNCVYTPQTGGTWTLWPGYRVHGDYGPYGWISLTPTVYYDKAHWFGIDNYGSSESVDYFYRFYLLTTVANPVSGSSVTAYVSMYNGLAGTSSNSFTYFFVGCRDGSYGNRDFGHTGSQTLTQTADSPLTGGGCLVYSTRTLDSSGIWTFWACYKTSSGLYGSQLHTLYMEVG